MSIARRDLADARSQDISDDWRFGIAYNAARVVAACEEFRAVNGRFPRTLNELVPQYLPSVPRAKYCLHYGEFAYFLNDGHALLVWCVVPPYYRAIYDFETRRWSHLD